MKKICLLSLVLLSAAVIALSGCGPSHAYYARPVPHYRSSVALIIRPNPGLRLERYPDGRYYYYSPEGYTYWRGYDNRYYLDRQYLNRGYYNQRQYNEWNHGYGKRRRR